jgi:hypothetical protein
MMMMSAGIVAAKDGIEPPHGRKSGAFEQRSCEPANASRHASLLAGRAGFSSGASREPANAIAHSGAMAGNPRRIEAMAMTFAEKWWPRTESNRRHGDFQSPALPTELLGHGDAMRRARIAEVKGAY